MNHKLVFILTGILISFIAFADNFQNNDDDNRSVSISIGDGETTMDSNKCFDPHSLKYPEKIKIPREPSDNQKSVTADKVNYVLTIWKRYPCLMNVHTGDLWYMKNPGTKRAK